jgi:hypothetical protein
MTLFKKKKKTTGEEYCRMLLDLSRNIDKKVTEFIGDQGFLNISEIPKSNLRIFSIWIITLVEKESDYIFRLVHLSLRKDLYSNDWNIDKSKSTLELMKQVEAKQKKFDQYYREFIEEFKKQVHIYREVLDRWEKNPKNGYILGNALTEVLINRNINFDIFNEIPKTDMLTSSLMVGLFTEIVKFTRSLIQGIKQEFIVQPLEDKFK